MTKIEKTSVIKVPVEKVWDLLSDFERILEYNDLAKEVKITSKKRGEAGQTAHYVYKLGGSNVEFNDKITEWVENEKIVWRTTSGDLNASGSITVKPVEEGTEITEIWDYKLPYSIIGKILDILKVRKEMEKTMDYSRKKRKEFLEKGESPDK